MCTAEDYLESIHSKAVSITWLCEYMVILNVWWWNISISNDYIWFSCHADGKYGQPIQLPILLEVMCKLLSKRSWKRPSREMGVSIYKKLSMKDRKVLNFIYFTYFGFYNVTRLQALRKMRTNKDCYKHIFFTNFFLLRMQKAEKKIYNWSKKNPDTLI